MGSFYANVTLLGTELDAVQRVAPRPAFLLASGGAVVVFAEADDDGAPQSGRRLSAELDCLAVSIAVHDDDILMLEVHDRGESVISGAIPDPSAYLGVDPEMSADVDPTMLDGSRSGDMTRPGGPPDAAALVGAVRRGDVEAVRDALDRDFVFATERHRALVSALELEASAVGWGFRYLSTDPSGYPGPPLLEV